MADVETPAALLVMAIRDLHDGEAAMASRLGTLRTKLDDTMLREIVRDEEHASVRRGDALAAIAQDLDADPGEAINIWMRAILDDADNDEATIARGRLRDIAVAGALRKAKQSQRVSYETAIALARGLRMLDAAASLSAMVEAAQAADDALGDALRRLSAAAVE